MPSPTVLPVDPHALRVLVTGYGPFRSFKTNPSWLAVKPLHNSTVYTADKSARPIHITSLEVPTTYETVLSLVPGIHSRPPVLPSTIDPTIAAPPSKEYDFILHVGVAGKNGSPVRLEQLGHKYGYTQDDAEGKYCPIAKEGDQPGLPPVRGFGTGYEQFPEELCTEVSCVDLLQYLKNETGLEHIVLSQDAGHYLCDFINYGSLAESRRTAASHGAQTTPVLFIHIPPVDEPLSTEQVTEVLKHAVSKVCSQLG